MTDKPKPAKKIRASKPKRDDLDTPAGKPRRVTTDATKHKLPAPEPDTGTEWDAWAEDRRTPWTLRRVASNVLLRVAFRLIKLAQRIGPLFAIALMVGCASPTAPVAEARHKPALLEGMAPMPEPVPVPEYDTPATCRMLPDTVVVRTRVERWLEIVYHC